MASPPPSPTVLDLIPAIMFGVLIGGAGIVLLWTVGAWLEPLVVPFVPVRAAPVTQEFSATRAVAWIYLIELVGVVVLIALCFTVPKFRSADRNVRAVVITALVVMLGGMALCNLFSSGSLFSRG